MIGLDHSQRDQLFHSLTLGSTPHHEVLSIKDCRIHAYKSSAGKTSRFTSSAMSRLAERLETVSRVARSRHRLPYTFERACRRSQPKREDIMSFETFTKPASTSEQQSVWVSRKPTRFSRLPRHRHSNQEDFGIAPALSSAKSSEWLFDAAARTPL